jgi:hypothetical protein
MKNFSKYLLYFIMVTLQVSSAQTLEDLTFLETYDQLKNQVVTPKATPQVKQGVDFVLDMDYIAWVPSQGGLAIAQSEIPTPGATTSSNFSLPQGSKYRPDFKLSSGFKVGIGADFDQDGWRTFVQYTWFKSRAQAQYTPAEKEENLTLWEGNFNVISYNQTDNLAVFVNVSDRGKSQWKLKFNSLDWLLERSYFLSRSFVFNSFFGFKIGWNTQAYVIDYIQKGISTILKENGKSSLIVTAKEDYEIFNHQSYVGGGPLIGCLGQWLMTKNCSWVFGLKLSNLWGRFTITRQDFSNVLDLGGSPVNLTNYMAINLKDSFYQLNAVFENLVGLNYSYWSYQQKYKLDGLIGWETQMWFDQNQFLQQGVAGNLSMQGLLLKLALHF